MSGSQLSPRHGGSCTCFDHRDTCTNDRTHGSALAPLATYTADVRAIDFMAPALRIIDRTVLKKAEVDLAHVEHNTEAKQIGGRTILVDVGKCAEV